MALNHDYDVAFGMLALLGALIHHRLKIIRGLLLDELSNAYHVTSEKARIDRMEKKGLLL